VVVLVVVGLVGTVFGFLAACDALGKRGLADYYFGRRVRSLVEGLGSTINSPTGRFVPKPLYRREERATPGLFLSDEENDALTIPKTDKKDVGHALVRAIASNVPILGAAAVELFNLVITPSLEKRRANWMNTVAERLKELEKKVSGFSVESLRENESFITVVTQATTIALRNNHAEKLAVLQNGVVNTALKIDIDESLQLMFLSLVDIFTPLHLKMLKYFDNPKIWLDSRGIQLGGLHMGGPSTVLEAGIPELKDQRIIYDSIVQDLYSRGLLASDVSWLHTLMSLTGMLESRTTDLGKRFVRYVSTA
jgi:hypothetical protein